MVFSIEKSRNFELILTYHENDKRAKFPTILKMIYTNYRKLHL